MRWGQLQSRHPGGSLTELAAEGGVATASQTAAHPGTPVSSRRLGEEPTPSDTTLIKTEA
jgi:hypothetical protein